MKTVAFPSCVYLYVKFGIDFHLKRVDARPYYPPWPTRVIGGSQRRQVLHEGVVL